MNRIVIRTAEHDHPHGTRGQNESGGSVQVVRATVLTDRMAAGWAECLERLEAFVATNGVLE
jgi:hypothetical protein